MDHRSITSVQTSSSTSPTWLDYRSRTAMPPPTRLPTSPTTLPIRLVQRSRISVLPPTVYNLGPDIFEHVANLVGLPLPDSDAAANQVADISDHAANQVGSTLPDIGAAANQVADILDHAVRSTLPDIHNIADNGDVIVANMWSDIAYLAAMSS